MDAVPAQSTSLFHVFSKVKFEDVYFNTYGDYKAYLSNMYGDYMTPPPKNERGGHADTLGDIIFDLNKDYSEYQKELSKS